MEHWPISILIPRAMWLKPDQERTNAELHLAKTIGGRWVDFYFDWKSFCEEEEEENCFHSFWTFTLETEPTEDTKNEGRGNGNFNG